MIRTQTSEETHYRCPLCGNRFTEKDAEACLTCPYAVKCSLVMCPKCHYEFPKMAE